MSNNKMGSKPDIPERKDVQERDDEILNENGIGPGTHAQTAHPTDHNVAAVNNPQEPGGKHTAPTQKAKQGK
jgi:hypothetical protein